VGEWSVASPQRGVGGGNEEGEVTEMEGEVGRLEVDRWGARGDAGWQSMQALIWRIL